MAPRSVGAGKQLVRHVPDQDVGERELLLGLDDRGRLAPDQVSSLELVEDAVYVGLRVQRDERLRPEDLSDHGRVEEQRPVALRQRIETGRDEPADARRQRAAGRLLHRRRELLDEERVALGELDDLADLLRVAEAADGELTGVLPAERPEGEARVAGEAAAPAGACVEQLRPRERDEEERES